MSEPKRPHGSRFRDALVIINPGACNPSGVALSLTAGAPRQKLRGLAAAEPSGHRDRAENLSKACGPRTTSVGVLSREGGSPMREFDPCACSHQYSLSHARGSVWG